MMPSLLRTLDHWRRGIRIYIASATIVTTLAIWWWASLSYAGTTLYATRMEEVFAWLSLALIAIAVSIGPTYNIFPKLWGKPIMADARRLLGVSAFWFASLHVLITYNSLFKLANPLTLPTTYQQSFLAGSIALIILFAMTATSFDKAFRGLGKWWFRLHRFVYVGLPLILLHALMTGAHTDNPLVILTLMVAAIYLVGIHGYLSFVKRRPTIWQLLAITGVTIALILIFAFIKPTSASAHVLKADLGISAVLHMPPDDNPVVGENTRIYLAFADTKDAFKLEDCYCEVHILQEGREIAQLPALKPALAGASTKGTTSYQFPATGAYELQVHGRAKQDTFPEFSFSYIVRASGGSGSQGDTAKGQQALIIGAGALTIVGMLAYLNMSSGGRYTTKPEPTKRKHKKV